ncbi:MAG: carboxymuconolactone decarboxylase family protein [Pseudolabrys sp.]
MPRKRPAPRLALIEEDEMNEAQRALLASLRAGPRGQSITPRGPFAAWMHAPELGELAQTLGAHCRYRTTLEPRLSEFAILCTARTWRAQYEWYAHAPMAEKAGVKPQTISAITR